MGDDLAGPSKIFVSYRRDDSSSWTAHLVGELRRYYGEHSVYLDVSSNHGGQDFVRRIDEALDTSRMVIAVIGPEWLAVPGDRSSPRIHDPEDQVRRELEAAFRTGIALTPVLVGGARMPPAGSLPDSLRPLSTIQGVRLSDDDWEFDFGRLLESLERHGLAPSREPGQPALEWDPSRNRRYQRRVKATRKRTLDAVTGAVEQLRYPDRKVSVEAASVTFTVLKRPVQVDVLDDGPGHSMVVITLVGLKTRLLAGGVLVAGLATGGWGFWLAAPAVAIRLWERRFTKGLFDNVERVLDGKGIGEDSALLPGYAGWRDRIRNV